MRYDHFIRNVDKSGENGCWIWIGRRNRHGYGEHRSWEKFHRGKYFAAHRLSWEFHVGKIPPGSGHHGTVVAHKCDNRACVNPDHLFLTTQKGNLRDCLNKGRGNKAFGERAGRAMLREKDVIAIRKDAARGIDRGMLAERHCVTNQTIVDIVGRKSWKHLQSDSGVVGMAPRRWIAKPNSGSFQKGSKGNPGPKPEMRTADYEKIRAMFGKGMTVRQIAIACGTTHPTVTRVAKHYGITADSPFKRMNASIKNTIRELAKTGLSQRRIAIQLHVSGASVSRTIAATGAALH